MQLFSSIFYYTLLKSDFKEILTFQTKAIYFFVLSLGVLLAFKPSKQFALLG